MMVVASTIKCYLIYQICLLKCALHSSTMLLLADLQKNDINKRFLILQLYHHVDILVEFECLSQASFLCQPLFLLSLGFSWLALCACNRKTVLPHTWDYFSVESLSPRVYPWRTHLKHQEWETLMVGDCNNYPYVPRNRNHAYFVCEYYKVVHNQDQLSSK